MKILTSFDLKIIAIVTMVIDHIGLFFFPQYFFLRVIGRLSFPLFAFLIANGAVHTKNIYTYLGRLLIFAVIAQGPYILANRQLNSSFWELNVLFTLFLGLLAIIGIKNVKNWFLKLGIVLVSLIIPYFVKTDYGILGILSIIGFYMFFSSLRATVLWQISIFLVIPIFLLIFKPVTPISVTSYLDSYIEPIGLLSLIFIASYNGKRGVRAQYLFYFFYPLQYIFIYAFLVGSRLL